MHASTLKKLALALTFWVAVHVPALRAQILLGPYSNSTGSMEVDANGLLSDTGNLGTGSLSLSGAGTRMFWYPGKAAFRAGGVDSTEWDDSNIGQYSTAFGWGSVASGNSSTASGFYSTASGMAAFAFGIFTTASGSYSVALGCGTASGASSTVWGAGSTASGYGSTASGLNSYATGSLSTAFGESTASGQNAFAAVNSGATGDFSAAFGTSTTASSYCSFALGSFNTDLNADGVTAPSTSAWVATDPLFEIGNGTYTAPSDALVVYKSGNAVLQGTLQAAPGGDIPMYTGN